MAAHTADPRAVEFRGCADDRALVINVVEQEQSTADQGPGGHRQGAADSAAPYEQRVAANQAQAAAARKRRNVLSWLRLVAFVLLVAVTYQAVTNPAYRLPGAAGGFFLLIAFIYLVVLQRRAEEVRARSADLVKLNSEAISRVRRDWSSLPRPLVTPELASSPLSRDLALTGRGSLLQLLGSARTSEGRRILGEWLVAEPTPDEIARRQSAARELAPMLDLRQEIERLAMRTPHEPGALEPFHSWAATASWLGEQRWLRAIAQILPFITISLIILFLTGLMTTPVWLALLPVHAVVWVATAARAGYELGHLEMRAGDLDRFASIFALLSVTSFEAPRLTELQGRLRAGGLPAERRLRQLAQLVEFAEVRTTPLLYIPLQLVTLWDLHLIGSIDRWRAQTGAMTRDWLAAVGEVEALAALAGLSYDNPDWCFPEFSAAADSWSAEALAHPLIPADQRVSNDVELGPPGKFVLVTGSNMSGKSTLMRAVGVNIALGQAGGPVCARSMRLPVTTLGTAFVIEDSLEDGVSYFMAELRRLKEIVDDAAASSGEGAKYLFLLDEILKGTNSGERQIAVRRILEELLGSRAAGAITTHDLALAEVEELRKRSRAVHFKETFVEVAGAKTMHFDYKLHDGVATTTNALALLEMVGITERQSRG